MGSGGMIVMDEDDCMVSVARFYLDFTVEESCGKCTPCRIGNKRLLEILNKITEGRGSEKDLQTLSTLGQVIKDTALCGLGQTSPNPVLSTLNNFYDEYVKHAGRRPAAPGNASHCSPTPSIRSCASAVTSASSIVRQTPFWEMCASPTSSIRTSASSAACAWHAASSKPYLSANPPLPWKRNKLPCK